MEQSNPQSPAELEKGNLLLIVVGAHLRAETADRPLAYRLRQRAQDWIDSHQNIINVQIIPVVCCDILYVNQVALQAKPTISIGGPGVNALSAYLVQKLNTALVRENQLSIQLDPEFVDLRANVWGMDHALTVTALDLFVQKYFDGFMRAVATQVEPSEE